MKWLLDAADIEQFRTIVGQCLGLHFEDSKLDFLADVLRRRMEATGSDHFPSYYSRITSLASEREELRALAEQLTVCETYFFRYADHFRAFTETVLPDRLRARDHVRQMRILSAGCASGEEPYSLAMLIQDRLPDVASWKVTIHGIDVNPSMLEKAIRGRYNIWSLRETPNDLRAKYFRADGREFLLDGTVKSAVTFEERNLIDEDLVFWQREAFDIVFCRNVTMYFTPEATQLVIRRIADCLMPGGFLFLGHAETLRGISQDFHLRHTHETFYYQRRDGHQTQCTVFSPLVSTCNRSTATSIAAKAEPNDSWFAVIKRASERISNLTTATSRSPGGAFGNAVKQTASSAAQLDYGNWDRTQAMELLREERHAEATELLRRLPPESKADPEAQLLLAALLTNSGDLAEAEKICQRLLKLDELNAGAHYLMALCREHVGDPRASQEHDQVATYLDSAFAMPHLHLGLVAKRSQDVEMAKQELGKALRLLAQEDASRILLFGGGFTREALAEFCRAELLACEGTL